MKIEQAKSELMQIYGALAPNKQIAIDTLIKASVKSQEPRIKVLERDEVAKRLGTVDVYQASAWITLLSDLEYLGLKICEVEE